MNRYISAILIFVLSVIYFPALHCHAESGWKFADSPRIWSFPKDFGNHPEYATEWWYFTGNLQSQTGRKFGYQFTVFRVGLDPKDKVSTTWGMGNVYAAHFALTDVAGEEFYFAERLTRMGPGLVEMSEGSINLRLHNWRIDDLGDGDIGVYARDGDVEIDLVLTPVKPVVLHGDRGFSKKGPGDTQASHYFSLTRLQSTGEISLPNEQKPFLVSGFSWFDKEFGSNQLSEEQAGWDWFSLQFEDGRELMLYLIRRKDGSIEKASSGTIVSEDGSYEHLDISSFYIDVKDFWESPETGARYPADWEIKIPRHGLSIKLSPILDEQEIHSDESTGVVYWEGAVEGFATVKGERKTRISGYVEMTGYSGSLGGLF